MIFQVVSILYLVIVFLEYFSIYFYFKVKANIKTIDFKSNNSNTSKLY